MYCPKCGRELSLEQDGLVCHHGKMELTKILEEKLREVYSLKLREPQDVQFEFKVGGKWFCPQCGVATTEENGYIRCPKCKTCMNEFIVMLVENHYHQPVGL